MEQEVYNLKQLIFYLCMIKDKQFRICFIYNINPKDVDKIWEQLIENKFDIVDSHFDIRTHCSLTLRLNKKALNSSIEFKQLDSDKFIKTEEIESYEYL